jgi:very-short-patch-repair endonuclease
MSLSGAEADERRSDFLKRFNVRLIRFENKDVFEGLEGVLEEIRRNLKNECREASE